MDYQLGQANRLGNRASNQDRFSAVESAHGVLLILADGMSGHGGGERAAELFIEQATRHFAAQTAAIADPAQFFSAIIHDTHAAILRLSEQERLDAIPGTTGVLCLLQRGQAHWAHVGDSRLYLFRDGLPLYRTQDDSFVEQLYQKGLIDRAARATHPLRNQVTQCMGYLARPPQVTVSKAIELRRGDMVLLCSDGLWGALDDAQLGALLDQSDLDRAAHRLAEQAERLSYPQSDNISVLALRVIALGMASDSAARQRSLRRQHTSRPARAAPRVEDAIEQIEQVIREYEKEMKG